MLVYSDAEGNGNIAAVLLTANTATYFCARVPRKLRRLLKARATNIVAYEFIAAIVAILVFSPLIPPELECVHNIDSTPALNRLIKGYSRQDDLCSLVGQI